MYPFKTQQILHLKKYELYNLYEWLKSICIVISYLYVNFPMSIRKYYLFPTPCIWWVRRKYILTLYITPVPKTIKFLSAEYLPLCFFPQMYAWISIQTNAF